jgi:hypothetical protein
MLANTWDWLKDKVKALGDMVGLTATSMVPTIAPALVKSATLFQRWAQQMEQTAEALGKNVAASIAGMTSSMVTDLAQGTFDGQKILLDFAVKTLGMIVEWAITGMMAAMGLSEALAAAFANPYVAIAVIAGLIAVVAGLSASYKAKAGGTALATGGMTTGQMQATIGDNPSGHELVMPMDSPKTTRLLAAAMPEGGGRGEQTIIVELDGRVIAQNTVEHMPAVLRLQSIGG